jgi:hypothetical protein
MILFDFIDGYRNEIINELIETTNNNIVIGGSCSLYLQGAINRDTNDLDVNISKESFEIYQSKLEKIFNFYLMGIGNMHIKNNTIYTCKHLKTKQLINLFVTENLENYTTKITYKGNELVVISMQDILLDKQNMVSNKQEPDKHLRDINSIKTHLTNK